MVQMEDEIIKTELASSLPCIKCGKNTSPDNRNLHIFYHKDKRIDVFCSECFKVYSEEVKKRPDYEPRATT